MKKFLQFCLVMLLASIPLWAEINILSPAEGEWSNRQMLVIDNSSGGDFFYSIDGADPETFGFAYDGPVLLDVSGIVNLKITRVTDIGDKETTAVQYSVIPNDGKKMPYKDFIQSFYESGILNYSAGSNLVIPQEFVFCLGLENQNFIPARTLSLSSSSILSRYIPCTIYDKSNEIKYRFVIKTFPQSAGLYSHRDVPFKITNWDTITFTDKNFIYKIDSEYWGLPTEPRTIDRSVSHMISWQNLEYDSSNSVEFFVLPPRPEIIKHTESDGSISYTLEGDESYTLSVYDSISGSYSEMFPEIGIDAFYGDNVSGRLTIGIFSNSVYQGNFTVSYNIDRKPPAMPVITSNAEGFCSRGLVDVKVSVKKGTELYVALSEPLNLTEEGLSYSPDNEIFADVKLGPYRKVRGESFTLHWAQNGLNPVFYKLSAYSKSDDNKSSPVEFCVLIDQSNYYFDSNSASEIADGTDKNPFTDFRQLADALAKQRVVKLRVKGDMAVNDAYSIGANFEIEGDESAKIIFGPKGSFNMKAATIEISHCRIHNIAAIDAKSIVPLIKLENSVLTMKDCVIGADFTKTGNMIDSYNSIVNISDTIASVNAASYVAFISSVKSRITIKKSSLNTNADTSVVISANGGSLSASKNEFMVSGGSGRVAELFGVNADFKENIFKSHLTNGTSQINPIYVNKATKLIEEKNTIQGF